MANELSRKLDALAGHCETLGRDRSTVTVSWQRSVCIAPTSAEAEADLAAGMLARGVDLSSMNTEQRDAILDRFIVGDPDTVGERLAADLALGIDGFTLNLPLNGHIPGRVELLGKTASKVVFGA